MKTLGFFIGNIVILSVLGLGIELKIGIEYIPYEVSVILILSFILTKLEIINNTILDVLNEFKELRSICHSVYVNEYGDDDEDEDYNENQGIKSEESFEVDQDGNEIR